MSGEPLHIAEHVATLRDVRPKKKGPADDKVLTLEVQIDVELDAAQVGRLIGEEEPESAARAFWRENNDADPRFWGVGEVKAPDAVYSGMVAVIDGVELTGAKAHKWAFTPEPGRVAQARCTVEAPAPDERTVSILAELIGETVTVSLYCEQASLFEGQAA